MGARLGSAELLSYFQKLSNWNRWGAEDQIGTLNLITPEKRIVATKSVLTGESICCSRTISPRYSSENTNPLLHFMIVSGESDPGKGKHAVGDWVAMPIHSNGITHLDALAHEAWDGKIYNGRPAATVTTVTGASVENVEVARSAIVTRGVLLDVPRWKGMEWLEPGYGIDPEELDACSEAQGVKVEAGDALLVRVGRDALRSSRGVYNPKDGWAGLHASCLPWLRTRDVAVLGSDSLNDVTPSGFKEVDMPVHAVGIAAMGLWLMDHCYLEELAAACAKQSRWHFLFVLAPLRLKNSTGSPVNPIALL